MKKQLILVFSIIFYIIFPFKIIQTVSLFYILIFLLSYLYSRLTFYFINAEREKDIYYFNNGENGLISLKVINRGFLPISNILIKILGNGLFENREGIYLESIMARSSINLNPNILTFSRGVHYVNTFVVKGQDPLNFFPWEKEIRWECKIIIYPKYSDIDLILKNGEKGGNKSIKDFYYEDLSDLKSIRDYRTGDSFKKINWRATAKMGKLQTMEYSNNLRAPLFIIMDINPLNYPIRQRYTYVERTIELAASLVTSYSKRGEAIGLLTSGADGTLLHPPLNGYSQTVSILESLAEITYLEDKNDDIIKTFIHNKINLPEGSNLYLLKPHFSEIDILNIHQLKKHRYNITLINSGGEDLKYNLGGYKVLELNLNGEDYLL